MVVYVGESSFEVVSEREADGMETERNSEAGPKWSYVYCRPDSRSSHYAISLPTQEVVFLVHPRNG
jgi:hypothetical protein